MKAKLILENNMVFEGKAFGYLHECTGDRRNDIKGKAPEQHRTAAKTIGEGAGDQCAKPNADQKDSDDKLALVGIGHTQIARHHAQCGQHHVDRQRLQRLQHRQKRDKLAFPDGKWIRTGTAGRHPDPHTDAAAVGK